MLAYADDVSLFYNASAADAAWMKALRMGHTEAGDSTEFIFNIASASLAQVGLRLNGSKTQIACLSDNLAHSPEWVQQRLRMPLVVCGVDVLGRGESLQIRLQSVRDFVSLIFRRFGDTAPLIALRMARLCAVPKAVHHITGSLMSLEAMNDEQELFCTTVRSCLRMTEAELPSRVITLPARSGGLGLLGPRQFAYMGALLRLAALVDEARNESTLQRIAAPEIRILDSVGIEAQVSAVDGSL